MHTLNYIVLHSACHCNTILPIIPDVADKAEASLMLHSINEMIEQQSKTNDNGQAAVAQPIYHTLALLHTVLGELDKVKFYILAAAIQEIDAALYSIGARQLQVHVYCIPSPGIAVCTRSIEGW